MNDGAFKQYRFDEFKVDAQSCCLYFDDKLVEKINKKSLQVLIVLLEKPRQVVSHDEIIAKVWGEDIFGIDSRNIAQYILKLRKVLAQYRPQKTFIGTGSKRGYIFEEDVIAEIKSPPPDLENVASTANDFADLPPSAADSDNFVAAKNTAPTNDYKLKLLIAFSAIALIVAVTAAYFSTTDEDRIRQVVRDSQMYESLTLYANPKSFDENELKKYWIDEPNATESDIFKVRNGVKNLLQKGVYYGRESKCERFDFVSVEVSETRDFAVAKTIEKWFVAKYGGDGKLLENKIIGPYSITYNLRKVDDRWLIEKSSTARAGG